SDETFLDVTRRRLTRPFAALCGISLASGCMAFQFGNCLGVTVGVELLLPGVPPVVWPVAFTAAALVFLFGFRAVYRILEKVMIFFLIVMLGAFTIQLVEARPDLAAAARGALVPSLPGEVDWVTVGGLIATTFVLVAVIFQSYAVKAKGWDRKDFRSGLTDALLASVIVTMLGSIILMTAAATLHARGIEVSEARDMALQLEKVFGRGARIIFGVGFGSAAFTSFITNALAGGVLVSDGLGLGGRLDGKATRIFAAAILLVGLATSLVIILRSPEGGAAAQRADPKVIAIMIGQAATLLAVPLGTIAMVFVLLDRRATQGRGLPLAGKALVIAGAIVLLGTAAVVFQRIRPAIRGLFE
ncbi:MAG: divalent metal cation transporter, partial [Planctomycetes bacterium]|nr:divalent metal cation transporter [Planctomycetota bacterium]